MFNQVIPQSGPDEYCLKQIDEPGLNDIRNDVWYRPRMKIDQMNIA